MAQVVVLTMVLKIYYSIDPDENKRTIEEVNRPNKDSKE